MGFGDIRMIDTALRNLPALNPTGDLQNIGRNMAMWEVIGEHLAGSQGLTDPIKKITLTVLGNNLQLYRRIGAVKNEGLSAESIHGAIDAARDAEKAAFRTGKTDHPLAIIKEKLWIVEGEWNSAKK
jgi:hypothetical protein